MVIKRFDVDRMVRIRVNDSLDRYVLPNSIVSFEVNYENILWVIHLHDGTRLGCKMLFDDFVAEMNRAAAAISVMEEEALSEAGEMIAAKVREVKDKMAFNTIDKIPDSN